MTDAIWNETTRQGLIEFYRRCVQIQSFSDEEGELANYILGVMKELDYDEAYIDGAGNVVGRVGDGDTVIHFDSHMDTVRVNDAELWQHAPFAGEIVDGVLWGRGSVDIAWFDHQIGHRHLLTGIAVIVSAKGEFHRPIAALM